MLNSDDFLHLCRLGLSGDDRGFHTYVRRTAKKYAKSDPILAQALNGLLSNTNVPAPTRWVDNSDVPVDLDSRLKLLRFVRDPEPSFEPTWDDHIQKVLSGIVLEQEHAEELRSAGLHPAKSLLFTGVPGVGKTFAAQWIAYKLGKPLAILDLSSVMSSFLGRTGTNVRYVLEYAKSVDCVLLLDEVDSIAKRRDDAADVGELKRLVTVLLQEIDNWSENGLLIAATNHPELLDPAVWRRFDHIVDFPVPSREAISQAIKAHLGAHFAELSKSWVDALAIINKGRSYSDVERDILSMRRLSVIEHEPIREKVKDFISQHVAGLGRADKTSIAVALWAAGVSQRDAQEMTGVARETIRAAHKASVSVDFPQ